MAGDATVDISQSAWFSAINAPGGVVSNWRDKAMLDCLNTLFRNAPVNSPLNRRHRPWDPGRRYKFGFNHDRTGNQSGNGFRIGNREAHAVYVELGRRASSLPQRFSWTGPYQSRRPGAPAYVPGTIKWWGSTGARRGTHFLERTVTRVTAAHTR